MIDDVGPAAALPPHERLVYLIGKVCVADVWLEEALRHVFRTLAVGGPAESPRDFSPLLSECGLLLNGSESGELLGEAVVEAARRALSEANAAHLERNRIVHDMWLPAAGPAVSPPAWERIRSFKGYDVTSESKTIDDVEQALERLHRASIRVSSIVFTLAPHWTAELRQLALEIVEGYFDLLPDGGYRPHSWACRTQVSEPSGGRTQ